MLCVSIHDVAPATWADCLRLVQAVREVADIPLTWLVVPHYHFRPERSAAMEACLDVVLERGDELALHGYSHLDTEANSGGLRGRFLRNVYTRREGEFAALDEAEAQRRLELGRAWFAERGWTPSGFVPPAWLLGKGAWRALRASGFAYTSTFSHFHCLPGAGAGVDAVGGVAGGGRAVLSPSLVYAARNRGGRLLSPRIADATAAMLANAPLVRFGLHPPDARYPELLRHTQRVLERLLEQREAVTKVECARRLMLAPAAGEAPVQAPMQAPAIVIGAVATAAVDGARPAAAVAAAQAQDDGGADDSVVADVAVADAHGVDEGEGERAAGMHAVDADAEDSHALDAEEHVAEEHVADAHVADAHVQAQAWAGDQAEAQVQAQVQADTQAPTVVQARADTHADTHVDAPADALAELPPAQAPDAPHPGIDFGSRHRIVPTFARIPVSGRRGGRSGRAPAGGATSTAPTIRPASGPSPSRHSSADRDRSAAGRPWR